MSSLEPSAVTDDQFIQEGLRIVAEGQSHGMPLRLLGSVAIRLHSPSSEELYKAADRPLTDLDFMSYGKFSSPMPGFFDSLGYESDAAVLRHFGRQRQVFWSRDLPGLHCDVFFDKLSFCHDIVFAGRLDDETVTIRPSDLLLEKLQIVQINEKDLKDLAVLLREHPLGDDEADAIGAAYVAGRVSGDWGFWYTLTTNLDKLATYVGAFAAFPEADRQIVIQRIVQLRQIIDDSPKTTSWKMRAKIGTRKKWYRDVEEVSL